jgi:hypothetical protein
VARAIRFLDHFPFFVTGFAGAADPKNDGSAFREKANPPEKANSPENARRFRLRRR